MSACYRPFSFIVRNCVAPRENSCCIDASPDAAHSLAKLRLFVCMARLPLWVILQNRLWRSHIPGVAIAAFVADFSEGPFGNAVTIHEHWLHRFQIIKRAQSGGAAGSA